MPSASADSAPASVKGADKRTKKKSRSPSSSSSSSSSRSKSTFAKRKKKKEESSSSSSDSESSSESEATTKKKVETNKAKVNGKKVSAKKKGKDSSSSSDSDSSSSSSSDDESSAKKKAGEKSKGKSPPKRKKSKSPTSHKPTSKTKASDKGTEPAKPADTLQAVSRKSPPKAPSPSPSPPPPPPPPVQKESDTSKKETKPKESNPKEVTKPNEDKKAKEHGSPAHKKGKIDSSKETETTSNKKSRSKSPAKVKTDSAKESKTSSNRKSRSKSPPKKTKRKSSRSRSRDTSPHRRTSPTIKRQSKSPVRRRRSRSSSSESSSGRVKARQKGRGGITIGRKTGGPSRQSKGVRVSRSPSPVASSASGNLKSIAASETAKEKSKSSSSSSSKTKVDKSDTSLFKEDSNSSAVQKTENGSKKERTSRFGPPVPLAAAGKASEPAKERKPAARPPPKPVNRSNPDTPLTLPQWCDLVAWHDKRDVHLEMMRRSEKLGTVSLQKRRCYVIGRTAPLCDIAIDHPSLSRRHAVILHHRENGCVYVMDLKSTQGTWVNRRKLIPHLPTALTEKCILSFGTSTRTYHIRGLVPENADLPKEMLAFLETRNTLENTVIEGVQMGEDGPLPFHSVTIDDKQLVHDEPLPEENARLSKSKPANATASATSGRFEDMEPDTAFVPLSAETTGTAQEEKLKHLTPAARLVFLRKQEEERAAAARKQALRAMSAGKTVVTGRATPIVPVVPADEKAADEAEPSKKENLGLYDVIELPGKRPNLDAKQKKILLNGSKIPSISSSFCSSSSSSKKGED